MCVCVCVLTSEFSHTRVPASFIVYFPNYPLVGTTSSLIPSFESCHSLGILSSPHLISFTWHLSGLHLPEVLARCVLRTCWGATGTTRTLELACTENGQCQVGRAERVRHLAPDPNTIESWWMRYCTSQVHLQRDFLHSTSSPVTFGNVFYHWK